MKKEGSAVFASIGDYYNALVARYGHDPRACDYGRAESQQAKFKVLSEATPLAGKRVLDVGCGFADYAGFLEQRFPDVVYVGVDISQAMVDAARGLRADLSIQHLDILCQDPGRFDVVTANGIFYLLGENAPVMMRVLITRMFALACDVVAFNSLSAWAPDPQPDEYYADPLETLSFCRTLTPWVVLRHDYHPHDFTIYMYRSQNV